MATKKNIDYTGFISFEGDKFNKTTYDVIVFRGRLSKSQLDSIKAKNLYPYEITTYTQFNRPTITETNSFISKNIWGTVVTDKKISPALLDCCEISNLSDNNAIKYHVSDEHDVNCMVLSKLNYSITLDRYIDVTGFGNSIYHIGIRSAGKARLVEYLDHGKHFYGIYDPVHGRIISTDCGLSFSSVIEIKSSDIVEIANIEEIDSAIKEVMDKLHKKEKEDTK